MSGVLSITKFEFNNVPFDVIVDNSNGENKSYFFGSKVALALGYKNVDGVVRRHCRKTVSFCKFDVTPPFSRGCEGGMFEDIHPQTVLIPESDVYRLVMKSQKPESLEFQDFVCETVLPTIRKHGTYPAPGEHKHPPAIGYNIGTHQDRMNYFESLSGEQKKDMRKETLTETNSLKSERHMDIGGRGGKKTQVNIRTLQMDYKHLLEKHYRLLEDYDRLQEDFEFYTG